MWRAMCGMTLFTLVASVIGLGLNRWLQWCQLSFREEMLVVTAFSVGNTMTLAVMWAFGWFLPPWMLDPKKRQTEEEGKPEEHIPAREEVLQDPLALSTSWMEKALHEGPSAPEPPQER